MRRVVCRAFGTADGLVVETDAAVPEVRPGTVLVEVEACALNFVDALMSSGGYQIKPPLPYTPGGEIAGRVVACGEGVSSLQVGERVVGLCGLGGCAEFLVMHELSVAPVPERLSATAAAGLIQAYATMLFAYRRAGLRAGEHVLVLGAGGGVGLAAIDLAHALGAGIVLGAASSDTKRALASAAGADATIDYEAEDLKTRARALSDGGIDVVVDPVGGRHAPIALRTLRSDGRYLVIGFASGEIPSVPLNHVLLNNRRVVGVDWGGWSARNPLDNRALITEVLDLAASGAIHPVEPEVQPLEATPALFARLLRREVAGKIAVTPNPV